MLMTPLYAYLAIRPPGPGRDGSRTASLMTHLIVHSSDTYLTAILYSQYWICHYLVYVSLWTKL